MFLFLIIIIIIWLLHYCALSLSLFPFTAFNGDTEKLVALFSFL